MSPYVSELAASEMHTVSSLIKKSLLRCCRQSCRHVVRPQARRRGGTSSHQKCRRESDDGRTSQRWTEPVQSDRYGLCVRLIRICLIFFVWVCLLTSCKFGLSGDHFYKRNKALPPEDQMISAMPDVKVLTLNEDHDFMVIACDGIWWVRCCSERLCL